MQFYLQEMPAARHWQMIETHTEFLIAASVARFKSSLIQVSLLDFFFFQFMLKERKTKSYSMWGFFLLV